MNALSNILTHSQGSAVFCLTNITFLQGPASKPFVTEGIDGLDRTGPVPREHFRVALSSQPVIVTIATA